MFKKIRKLFYGCQSQYFTKKLVKLLMWTSIFVQNKSSQKFITSCYSHSFSSKNQIISPCRHVIFQFPWNKPTNYWLRAVCCNTQLRISTPRHVQAIYEAHPAPYGVFGGAQKMKHETHVRLLQRLETVELM